VSSVKGVVSVRGDNKTKMIVITYQGKPRLEEQIKEEIIKTGHVVS